MASTATADGAAVDDTCEAAYNGDPLAIEICTELRSQGVRIIKDEIHGTRRMELPPRGRFHAGETSMQLKVELPTALTQRYDWRSISRTLNKIFQLDDPASSVRGQYWVTYDPASPTIWTRKYIGADIQDDLKEVGLFNRLYSLLQGIWRRHPRKVILVIGALALWGAWQAGVIQMISESQLYAWIVNLASTVKSTGKSVVSGAWARIIGEAL